VFGVALLSATLSTVDLVTLRLQHPPLATSPHPEGPSANTSTGQKTHCTIYWERKMDKRDYVKYMNLKAFRSNVPKVQDKEAKDQISKIQVGGLASNVQLFPARNYKMLALCVMTPSNNKSLTM
jgi:hypothetical protein